MVSKRRFLQNVNNMPATTPATIIFYRGGSSSPFTLKIVHALFTGMILLILILSPSVTSAHDGHEDNEEEEVIARDDSSIERPSIEEHHEESAELGHKLHPIHTAYQSRISGWLTAIAQGTSGVKTAGTKTDTSEGSISMDIFYESAIDGSGLFTIHFDVQQGNGITNIPSLLVAPNGNPTGPNNDIESFVNEQMHLVEAWYETTLADGKLTVTLGQIDPTVYFDTNNYANNERFQFLANEFGNNTAIEFGGTGNFYGAGFRLTYSPSDFVDISLGALEGDGDYIDMFNRPFTIAEVDLKPKLSGKEGNYRFYYWENHLTHYGDFLTVTGGTTNPTVIGEKTAALVSA